MGTGHVMRCLALAQGWQDAGGRAAFVQAESASTLEERIRSFRMEVIPLTAQPGSEQDARQTADLACQVGASWIVLDGYHFDANYQRLLVDTGQRVLTIDDHGHAESYPANVVLNQNLHACATLYPCKGPQTRLLLGTRYVLLRREFSGWRGRPEVAREAARRVLVTLGGSDPENVTLRVIGALEEVTVPNLEVAVVAGAANPHLPALRRAIDASTRRVELLLDVADMPALMAAADVALAAAGTTSWELAFMGVPSILLVLADNQAAGADGLARAGAALSLGPAAGLDLRDLVGALEALLRNREHRRAMADRARSLVDGRGTERVVTLLREGGV
jgi:UDP-2,4-diacetamido-2,4,6-trideoxy-beta-L-altropyranose hydrolase